MKPKKPYELRFFNYGVSSDALSTDTSEDKPDITEALQWTKVGKMRLVQIWKIYPHKELQIGVIQNGRCFSNQFYRFPACLPGDRGTGMYKTKTKRDDTSPKNKGKAGFNRLPVMINGVLFSSITTAAKELGVAVGTIIYRIRIGKPGYSYAEK